MNKDLNIFSLWAIDSLDDVSVLKTQMDDFASLGFNGIVFHPRRYSGGVKYLSKEYMDILSELILYAKSMELDFWIYDENGWPSGSADGEVLKAIPDLKCKWLEYDNGKVEIKERNGINSLDKRGVEEFVKITHEGYKNGLSKEAFDYVGGFFSDEVGFLEGHGACMDRGGIPWSDEIEEAYDGNVKEKLSELFIEEESEFKIWYWETLTKLLADNFYGTIEKWCVNNGKLYTAHLKGEENPFFQIGYSGSCFQVLKNISVPGIDALERYTGNKFYPRIASSLSKQFGNGIAMAEAMGGAGWGLTPEDFEKYTCWLIRSGINMFIFHINQLHLTYDSITDWPSSIPCHQPWREVFPTLIRNMRDKAEKMKECDTLLICPTRGVMNTFSPNQVQGMNEHNGSYQMICKSSQISTQIVDMCDKLYADNMDFDVTDEKILEDYGKADGEYLIIGNCRYKKVIAADGCVFSEKGRKLVKQFEEKQSFRQSEWQYITPANNRYFVEIENGKGNINTKHLCNCTLLVSDMCDNVLLNDIPLMLVKNDEYGYWYCIPEEYLKIGNNTLVLQGREKAFVYVIGNFAVKNRYPYYEYDNRQLSTKNGFYITEKDDCGRNFVLSGYPFSAEPIVCIKEIENVKKGYMEFDCRHIAAAQVFIDDNEVGWVYGGNKYIKIDKEYKKATLRCKVYQTAFNIYGPHHHKEGDRHLVSPMQFTGEKNFADTRSLPEYTLEDEMKFVKWQIAENIEFTEGNEE